MSRLERIQAVTPLILEDVSLDSSAASSVATTPSSPPRSPGRTGRRKSGVEGRDSSPFLNGVLFLAFSSAILGGASVGVGWNIDSEIGDVRSWQYRFWWGGAMAIVLGLLYLPCHILLKKDYPVGKYMYLAWIIFLFVGLVLLLVSATFSGIAYRSLKDIDDSDCSYVNFEGTFKPVTSCYRICQKRLATDYGNANLPHTCCCCRHGNRSSVNDIVYFDNVDSCGALGSTINGLRLLTVVYILSFIWMSCGFIIAAIVAWSCCRIVPPWFSDYVPSAAWLSIN